MAMGGTLAKSESTVCGIIMPISKSDDEHTAAHWEKVKDILSEAIQKAGCEPQPVWEGGAHDIIQAKILQNIYENPVVVCDLSTRNPNVMLEIGMRLTTKKPTLLVAEEGTQLPFDTGIIQTEFYDRRLEYRTIQTFIENLSNQITEKLTAFEADAYHPYLEAFKFETVVPSSVTVSSEERMTELIAQLEAVVSQAQALPAQKRTGHFDQPSLFSNNLTINKELLKAALGTDKKLSSADARDLGLLAAYKNDEISIGDSVSHDKFGTGVVMDIVGNKLEINFPDYGVKRVLSAFVEAI